MNSSLGSEIMTGFIGEVEGYLPDMSRCLETLQQDRAHRPSLAELHRITHTIKGAAAMVGLDDLSGIGDVLEKVMENILGASLILDDQTITLLGDATQRIDSYCMMQRAGRLDDGEFFRKTVAEIEEKLCKSTVKSDEVEGSSESSNPETILFEESEENVEEDFFTDDGSLFDEISSPVPPAEEALEDDLLFQDIAEEDDLFDAPGAALASDGVEPAEQIDQDTAGMESIDPELLECFREETEEHLENIDSCLNSLGVEITDSVELSPPTQEILHSLRRSVHTLKGAAAVIGIEPIAAWGHDFEDFLDWLHDEARKLDPVTVAALRDGADLLASLAEEPTRPAEKEKQRIRAKFTDITEAFSPESPESSLGSAADENNTGDKGEETGSFLDLLDLSPDSTADFFTEDDSDNSAAADAASLFDDISSPAPPAQEAVEDDFLFQDTDEEDDLFGPPSNSEDLFSAAGIPEKEQSKATAEAIDPELLECFREETDEHLENIDDCLNRLGVQIIAPVELTATTRETLHSLRRSVHTLKGAAAVIGIEQVAAWGHDLEDFLDWLHDEAGKLSAPIIALLRQGSDLLADIAEDPVCSVGQRKDDLIGQFNKIIAGNAGEGDILLLEEQEEQEEPVDQPFFDELPEISGADEQAVQADEEDIDEELLQCFHEEAEEHLDNIDRQLNHLGMTVSGETELSDLRRGSLHSIRRSVHTLKGAAAVIGIEPIAAWGHDFEDFLDWLHDEARSIHPEAVEAMQEGADILVRLVEDPKCSIRADQQGVLSKFTRITTDDAGNDVGNDIGKSFVDNLDNLDYLSQGTAESADLSSDLSLSSAHVSGEKTQTAPVRQSQSPSPSPSKKTATLRVDINRIDQMVGLSGDMVINLSSFEDSMDASAGTMKELDMILQRLKNINSSLEAGYELASIPHLGSQDNSEISGITEDFDPLEMDRYSELNILIRSLSEAVSDLDSIMGQNALDNLVWQKTVERQGMVLKELQNRMMGVRMTPLSTLSSRMHRTVREAERTTGHPARLTIDGETIMMDTRVWDVMADPLMHILRNAVAHGGRLAQKDGREPLSVTLQARRKGGQCTLRVSDNGKGLDYEAIRAKGMKLYPNDRVNLMSDGELADLIFRHGFSSTGSITNIAGRGVGMDVVRDAIDQLNGSTELISERGQGTEFIMRLPVAVAQLPAILARFGTQVYAIPMHDLASVVRATPEEKKGREYSFDGETIPLLHPANVPGFETGTGYIKENLTEDDQALLIVHAGRKRAAVLCEQLIGQRDIVFKDLGTHLHNVPCISGVTIMGNGTLIPILQVEEVLQKWTSGINRTDERMTVRPAQERGPLRILVVDDSISVRKVVSNFITQQGWIPIAARNGIEAIEEIRREKPDVILLDVEMPRMNGFEVLQALQAQPELRDIPVAMLTSRSAGKYQERAKGLGARGFMTKPFKEEEVIRFIRKETSDDQV